MKRELRLAILCLNLQMVSFGFLIAIRWNQNQNNIKINFDYSNELLVVFKSIWIKI